MLTRLLPIVVALAGCATVGKWGERALLAETVAVTACDRGQTQWMADGGKYDRGSYEVDPILGTHPSPARIDATNSAAIAGIVVGYRVLPPRLRLAMLLTVAVIETLNVATNPVNGGRTRPFCGGEL